MALETPMLKEKHLVSFGNSDTFSNEISPHTKSYWWDELVAPKSFETETIREILHISLDNGAESLIEHFKNKVARFKSTYNGEPVWTKLDFSFNVKLNKIFVCDMNTNTYSSSPKILSMIKKFLDEYMRTFISSAAPLFKKETAVYTSAYFHPSKSIIRDINAILSQDFMSKHGWNDVYYCSSLTVEADLDFMDKVGVPKTEPEAISLYKIRSVYNNSTFKLYFRNHLAYEKFPEVLQRQSYGKEEYLVSSEYINNISNEKVIRDFMTKQYSKLRDILFDFSISNSRRQEPGGRRTGYSFGLFANDIGSLKLDKESIDKMLEHAQFYTEAADMYKRMAEGIQALCDYKEELSAKSDRAVIAKYLDIACRETDMRSKLWDKAREFSCRMTEADNSEFDISEEDPSDI